MSVKQLIPAWGKGFSYFFPFNHSVVILTLDIPFNRFCESISLDLTQIYFQTKGFIQIPYKDSRIL